MALNFERLLCAFFGLGDDVDFHLIDCRFGFRIIRKYPSFIQVIIEFNKSGSLSVHCKRSKHNSCDVLFVHLTAVLEPFLHKAFSCLIIPLELVEHFPCPNCLPQLLLKHPTFGFFESHLTLFQCSHQ